MIDYESLKLMHFHGDEASELVETSAPHHDVASHDIEHDQGWYRKVFRCPTCNEEVVVDAKPVQSAAER